MVLGLGVDSAYTIVGFAVVSIIDMQINIKFHILFAQSLFFPYLRSAKILSIHLHSLSAATHAYFGLVDLHHQSVASGYFYAYPT
jgi:hypothetical protein